MGSCTKVVKINFDFLLKKKLSAECPIFKKNMKERFFSVSVQCEPADGCRPAELQAFLTAIARHAILSDFEPCVQIDTSTRVRTEVIFSLVITGNMSGSLSRRGSTRE
jgi:hypothetical protein